MRAEFYVMYNSNSWYVFKSYIFGEFIYVLETSSHNWEYFEDSQKTWNPLTNVL